MRAFFVGVMAACGLAGAGWGQVALRPPMGARTVDGQVAYAAPQVTGQAVLAEMSARADVIFCGVVTAVRMPENPLDALSGVVEVEFAVSNAVRGVTGGTYVMKEWAGLWRDGARYHVGDSRLMLLHAPGLGGMSSPVDGMDGAIPMGADVVDTRWLEAKTLHGRKTVPGGGAGWTKDVAGLMRVWEAQRNGEQ